MELTRVPYEDLNSRQRENYNFAKLASVLADYGYSCLRLSDDWNGADFIAVHVRGRHLMVQLKGRLTVDQKYENKNLYIAFREDENWFVYPHDLMLSAALSRIESTEAWREHKAYSWPQPPGWAFDILKRLTPANQSEFAPL